MTSRSRSLIPIIILVAMILLVMIMKQVASAYSGIKVNSVNNLFMDTASNKLYATSKLHSVFVIDVKKDTIEGIINFNRPIYAIGFDPNGNTAYMSSSGSNQTYVINTVTNTVANLTINGLKDVLYTSGISVDAKRHLIYVGSVDSKGSLKIIRIDTRNGELSSEPISSRCPVDPERKNISSTCPVDVQVNPNTGNVYILNSTSVWILNSTTTRISPIARDPKAGFTALAVDPQTNSTYLVNRNNNTVSVINGNTGKIIHIPVGHNKLPVSIALSKNKIYVANSNSSTISVIDKTGRNNTTFGLGSSPTSIAINTNNNILYIAENHSLVHTINGTNGNTVYGISFNVKPRSYGSIDCNVIPNNSKSSQNITIRDTLDYRSDNGTHFRCTAQRSTGKALDHWEGNLPVNYTMDPWSSFFLSPGNSTTTTDTNFTLSEPGSVTAVFTTSSFFADRYGNWISIVAVSACIVVAAAYSRWKVSKQHDEKEKISKQDGEKEKISKQDGEKKTENNNYSDILTIDATIIAGVLILLSVSGAFKQTQITIITADIVFPFALSVIAGLARKPVYAKTFTIVGCVNFISSIILVIIISFQSRI